MATAPVMPANLSAAEMKEWIEANPAVEQAPEVEEAIIDPETGEPFVEEQPRDEHGRFVSQNEPEGFEATVEKEIDLGDGSGVQLFRGVGQGATEDEAKIAAHEALADELAKAQANATRKIQELSRARAPEPPKEPTLTPDEELALSQQLLANPSKVLKEITEKVKREAIEEVQRQQEVARKAAEEAESAAVTFVQNTPDFYPCPENQERIERYLRLYQLPQTLDGINQAYAAVKDLLKTKPAEAARTTARTSAISTRRSAPAPAVTKPAGVDEEAFKRYCEENGLPVPAPLRRKF